MRVQAQISDFVKYLPRIGLQFGLRKEMRRVRYLGYVGESYADKRNYTYWDISDFDVYGDFPDYLVPQECGSRFDCDFVNLSDGIEEITITGGCRFSFSALPYCSSNEQVSSTLSFFFGEKTKTDFYGTADRRAFYKIFKQLLFLCFFLRNML